MTASADAWPLLAPLSEADRRTVVDLLERSQLAAGEVVVREGTTDRALYLVLDGEARMFRNGIEIGIAGRGQHFGELGLILGRPRAASVIAATPMTVAHLTVDRYLTLARERPDLALRLVQILFGGIADRLLEMTDSMGMLLRERSFPRRASVRVRVGGGVTEVRTGTPVAAVLPAEVDGSPVVAGLVDRRAVSLLFPLSSGCAVEPLTVATAEGERVLRDSVGLAVLEAAHHLDPPARVRLGHSLGLGQRVLVEDGGGRDLPRLAVELGHRLRTLVAADAPLREEWWTVEEASDHFRERGWPGAAELLATWQEQTVLLASYGDVYALSPGPLAASTGALRARLVADGAGLLLLYGDGEVAEAHAVSRQTTEMTSPQERWLDSLGVRSIGAFNQACIGGRVADLIRVSEGFQEKRVGEIADQILARRSGASIVCIAGPSSSGKTTFIKRLRTQLQVGGLAPVGLSLDDYYLDRDRTPRDAKGELDFESFEALQMDLLGDHISRLLRGERVTTASFDFALGVSHPAGGPEMQLEDNSVLMLEGIHGLNPRVLRDVPGGTPFRIFVCPLVQLPFDRLSRVHASDLRLIRRIVRDRHQRDRDAAETIVRWPSVRAGERRNIFPFQGQADAVFDSSLIYELSVLKVFAQRYLLEVPQEHAAYTTAFRLLRLLERLISIYPDHVPPTSILREFIGGTSFEY